MAFDEDLSASEQRICRWLRDSHNRSIRSLSHIVGGTNPPPSVFAATGTPRLIRLALDSVSTTTTHADSLPTNKSSLGVRLQSG